MELLLSHTFKNVDMMSEEEEMRSSDQRQMDVTWRIHIYRRSRDLAIQVHWISSDPNEVVVADIGEIGVKSQNGQSYTMNLLGLSRYLLQFTRVNQLEWRYFLSHFVVNGEVTISARVRIFKIISSQKFNNTKNLVSGSVQSKPSVLEKRVAGKKEKKKTFDDEVAKETSDVTLIVKGQKFHVCKMYLSSQSSYFKILFLESFSEAGKSEIELKDIDPDDFQNFLEFLYAESEIEDHTVLKILHLAIFSDSKTVIRKCETFLMEKSNLSFKQKLETAIIYKLEELKAKCLSEIKTQDDLKSIVPGADVQCGDAVWRELFSKAMSLLDEIPLYARRDESLPIRWCTIYRSMK